jgi:AmiR/NasT family two-component response regulator
MATIWTEHTHRVAQAAGMVSVQCGCSVDDAFDLMRYRAKEHGWTLDEVAAALIDRRIRLAAETA